jgi:Zn-dependent M28 family amino/carboxypeptidase
MTNALDSALDRIRPQVIDAHLRFLAHELLEGRAPGTRGGQLAVEYIRAQFQRAGLEPVDGSYLQPVPLAGLVPEPELVLLLPEGGRLEPDYPESYVAWAGVPEAEIHLDEELVYVGYGITAPEYEWDDYKDVDVRGKVLLMRVNDPGDESTPGFFGGKALTYYGRWTYKYEEASRRGAAGALLIHTDESALYGWQVVRNSNTGEQFSLGRTPDHPLQLRGWIRGETVRGAVRAAGLDPEELQQRSEQRDFRPVSTGIRLRAHIRSEVRHLESANVVGLLPGSDPERREEVIVISSHYDHLGTGVNEEGEPVVYHGAYDNASGVALILALADAMASLPEPPARSLLFLSPTAEESGLLGAEWYVRHPLRPLAKTAGVLNVDGVNLHGRTHDLMPLGVDRSELGEYVRRAAAEEGMTISPEPYPERGTYFRQDHFPFARAGVPAMAVDHGLHYEGRPEEFGDQWVKEYIAQHYHQPSDAYREGIDYGGAVQQGRVMLRAALALAAAARLPRWYEGEEFARNR